MQRYVCLHGHFYQPPRENPWLDVIEFQDSAYPFHDWNDRITAECYGPNAVARVLSGETKILRLVNNYARISFDFGPNLLSWMQHRAADVYEAVRKADADSQRRFGGHGGAIALPFAHPILPLLSPADKVTHVVWGVRDFQHSFGRDPEGAWLPECAVDLASLEVLAAHGIRFTILAPHQAHRARPRDGAWEDVSGGRIDTRRAYLQKLPSGRSIAIFFFNEPISRAVQFERLLESGEELANRLFGSFDGRDEPQLVHVANDGEAFGHHHSHGDMALAYALGRIESVEGARLTCYAEFLDLHPPQWEVQIAENTSWSCAHGIERWRADCGCTSRNHQFHQKWRGPMRDAIDALREAIRPAFESHAGDLLRDPAAARNDYVRVRLVGTAEEQDAFLDAHARRQLDEPARVKALELMELQRHLLTASVSCGWFFDEISSLESTQVLASATRAVQIAERLFAQPYEKAFVEALEQAPSNLPEYGNGRVVYEKLVRPSRIERQNLAAHYAISGLFESYPRSSIMFCYRIDRHDERTLEAGRLKMNVGHATLTSLQTRESWDFAYAALHVGDHNVTAGVGPHPGAETYAARAETFAEAFARADLPALLRLMDRHYGESIHSISSLFRDEQRRVLKRLLKGGLTDTMDLYARVYEQAEPLMRFLKHLSVPLPLPLKAATEVLCNTDLRWALDDDDPNFDQIRDLLRQAREWGVVLDIQTLRYRFSRLLARAAERWRHQPTLVEPMLVILAGLDLAREFPFDADLYVPQNVYFEFIDSTLPEMAKQAGDDGSRAWVERFVELGEKLGIDVAEVKKKLISPARRPKVAELVAELIAKRRVPLATYRLQMNKDFPFDAATEVVDYLDALGVSDVYLSPIQMARPGSMHGYDVCDPSRINPELCGEEGFSRLSERLTRHGMGVLLDVVPNHVGIGHVSNRWWMDVLENGAGSAYAHYFDVDWSPVNPDLRGKVLLPNLGDQFGLALEQGVFRLAYDKGSFYLSYYDKQVPLAPRSYHDVLSSRLEYLSKRLGEQHENVLEYRSILTALEHLPGRDLPPERRAERYREIAIVKKRLATLAESSPDVRAAVEGAVELYNGNVGSPASFDRLDALIGAQAYRPAFWQVAMEEINYRRFFDVNDLAAIRTELPDVFDATHEVPLRLLAEGKVHGLRIDHPDGLHSPTTYFRRLQERFVTDRLRSHLENFSTERGAKLVREALDGVAKRGAPWPLYVLAEKILGEGESLPGDWALDGTTGYDFLVLLNGLFVASENGAALDRVYADFVGEVPRFDELVRQSKRLIMEEAMASEINSLSHQLDRLAERNRRYRDFTLNNLQQAIIALITCLPVYRTYTTADGEVSARDRDFVERATEDARRLEPRTADMVFDFLRDTILLRNREQFPEEDRPRLLEWVLRFQQVTGPVMAKGIEDTAFYVYNRLTSLNEVGGHPNKLGTSVEEFHEQNRQRAERWPHGMLSTSTHDTKRSEDVRARINVLSELPDEWQRVVNDWKQQHAPLIRHVNGQPAPSPNDQYLFYQALLGVWEEGDGAALTKRLEEYVVKAAKEAKRSTSWINPEVEYDEALRAFVRGVLSDEGTFRGSLDAFAGKVSHFGRFNSLAQVLFKLTAPGVPDVYQGNELWDLSLVDPDNRRPVDYRRRRAALDDVRRLVEGRGLLETSRELLSKADDGRIKLFVTERALALRKRLREVFQGSGYEAVRLTGEKAVCGCAYLRISEGARVLVTGCVRGVRLTGGRTEVPAGVAWADTFLIVPGAEEGDEWVNELTGERVRAVRREGDVGVWAREAMATLPVGLLVAETQ